MKALTRSLKVLRSKNVTYCLISQSLADLDEIYGRDARRTILDNCPFQIVLGSHDPESQEHFSKLVGTIKVGREGASDTCDANRDQTSFSFSIREAEEPLIQPHE